MEIYFKSNDWIRNIVDTKSNVLYIYISPHQREIENTPLTIIVDTDVRFVEEIAHYATILKTTSWYDASYSWVRYQQVCWQTRDARPVYYTSIQQQFNYLTIENTSQTSKVSNDLVW